jgi:hypothetical protein
MLNLSLADRLPFCQEQPLLGGSMTISSSLFGLSAEDWRNIASFIVTPAFGFAAAYVFAIDLVKLPFSATDVPYKIPTRAIAMIAGTLCFSASFATAVWITLKVYQAADPSAASQAQMPITVARQTSAVRRKHLIRSSLRGRKAGLRHSCSKG